MQKLFATCALAISAALSGCISTSSTKYNDVERSTVSFETEKAGRTFYETLSQFPEAQTRQTESTSVNLIVLNLHQKTISGPNRFFNQAIELCDTNKDKVISETEADIFVVSSKALGTKKST